MDTSLSLPFEDSDLSGLPTSDPSDGKPWKYAGATGWQIVFGAFTPPAGVTDHGALTGLADDDHTQYVLVNGSRAMSGLLKLGGTTAAFPALKANSDTIQVRLADDSGYGSIESDWCMVRSTILVGTSNPSSYGRMSYQSGAFKFLKQDTTRTKVEVKQLVAEPLSINNILDGGIDLNSDSLGSTGVGYYGGNVQFFLAGVNRFNLSTGKDFRIPSDHAFGWASQTDNFAATDTAIRRVSDGVAGVYTSATGSTHGDFKASRYLLNNVAGSPWLQSYSNAGLLVYNASGSLGTGYANAWTVEGTGYYYFGGRAILTSSINGVIHVQNYDLNDATANQVLALGPATSASNGVRLKRVMGTTTVQVRNGNDSADASMTMANLTLSGAHNLAPITKASLLAQTPNASTGGRWRVTDSAPANREAYPDGTNWRWASDDTVVV